jgi:hypothetical protein
LKIGRQDEAKDSGREEERERAGGREGGRERGREQESKRAREQESERDIHRLYRDNMGDALTEGNSGADGRRAGLGAAREAAGGMPYKIVSSTYRYR